MCEIPGSTGNAFAAFDAGLGGSFSAVVNDILEILCGHNAVESAFIVRKIQLLVHLFFQLLVVQCDFLFGELVAPLERFESIGFWQTVDVKKFGSRGVDSVVYFLVLFSDVPEDLLFLFFVSAVYDAFLVFEATEGFIEAEDFIGRLFVEILGFLDGSGLTFFDLVFDGCEMFFGVTGGLIDFVDFFLFESLDITGGIFVDFLDVVFGKGLFVFLNDVLFDMIVTVKSDGLISDTGSTAH